MKDFVRAITNRSYVVSSEYFRELIRRDQDRQLLRRLLLEGASSEPGAPVDDGYFAALQKRAQGQ
ncbi:type II toxin-antitoxin system ParD family antitoxin [Mesorhizobium huakuii]|uniref:Type II toxin-antitoxin system ParD family antitoxin n=1 Tax=Mesorhizobium huakuii TaxID=28104 RepID=A0A7G6SVC3_9HYPH|nr:type II toxin-antitoxin system ParD family antitoxin [Mesorhizobium huakuii]QND58455.1 type II toxin-antitoxin system ParD family antitoxin [Mesorhizobium huakuii]